jgi:ASPM-SPD-2-Hydin domain-containing protein/centrosomal CEP192-like protein
MPVPPTDILVVQSRKGDFSQVRAHRSISVSARSMACAALLLSASFFGGCTGYVSKQSAITATPEMSLSTTSLNFQSVVVGQKATQTLTISNSGNGALQITSFSLSNAEYTISGPSVPGAIPASSSASYTLTFAPTAAGSAAATLNIASNASNAASAIALAGTGEKAFANLVVSPTVISFGNVTLKSTGTQNVTLQNTGDVSLSLQGVTVSGSGFGYSDLSPGFSLAPNQTVTFQVWFTPKVAGPATATLSVLSPNISSPGTLGLSGDGITTTTPPPTNPPPPTASTVALNWNASTSQVIGYRVYRSETSGSSYNLLTGTALNAVTYTDTTAAAGTTYYYVVTSVDSAGIESVYSNQVTAAVPAS